MNLLIETTRSIIKEGIVNVTGEELDENKIELLNLNHQFAPTENKDTIHGHYSNYRSLCIRFRTGTKIGIITTEYKQNYN